MLPFRLYDTVYLLFSYYGTLIIGFSCVNSLFLSHFSQKIKEQNKVIKSETTPKATLLTNEKEEYLVTNEELEFDKINTNREFSQNRLFYIQNYK